MNKPDCSPSVTQMIATELLHTLSDIPPMQFQGLALMTNPGWLANREAVRDAMLELITYTHNCQRAAQRLQSVPPVPLTAFVLSEWCL